MIYKDRRPSSGILLLFIWSKSQLLYKRDCSESAAKMYTLGRPKYILAEQQNNWIWFFKTFESTENDGSNLNMMLSQNRTEIS